MGEFDDANEFRDGLGHIIHEFLDEIRDGIKRYMGDEEGRSHLKKLKLDVYVDYNIVQHGYGITATRGLGHFTVKLKRPGFFSHTEVADISIIPNTSKDVGKIYLSSHDKEFIFCLHLARDKDLRKFLSEAVSKLHHSAFRKDEKYSVHF